MFTRRFLKFLACCFLLLNFEKSNGSLSENPQGKVAPVKPLKTYAMTASETHQYLWFRNAKVCTRSIFDVLIKNTFLSINTDSLAFDKKNFHGYFKFAFVRNPWDRIVSCYLNKVADCSHPAFSECFGKGFDYFVYFVYQKNLANADRHIQLQTELLPLGDLDFIGQFENFEEDFRYILKRLNITVDEIPHKNATQHTHYSTFYNNFTKELIRQKYWNDIVIFNYQFEPAPN